MPRTLVVGCEVGDVDVDERIGLSPPVAAAVDPTVSLVSRLACDLAGRHGPGQHPSGRRVPGQRATGGDPAARDDRSTGGADGTGSPEWHRFAGRD